MQVSGRLAVVGLAAVAVWLLYFGGVFQRLESAALERVEDRRMRNVTITDKSSLPVSAETAVPETTPNPQITPEIETVRGTFPPEPQNEDVEKALMTEREDILETTIAGGLTIKNETDYKVDVSAMLMDGTQLRLPSDAAQILIIHTHSSEAYTPAGLDRYTPSDDFRTEESDYNVIRVGEELAALWTQAGLKVIHDTGVYDYPSYTGSYNRSAAAIEQQLKEHPGIVMVIDVHRDALGENGVVYKTMAEEDGVCASQVMMLVGSDASGLKHPLWRQNLSTALYLQQAVTERYPTLLRPITLVNQRYNQHLSCGSMIVEVGSSGNTLQEALAAIRLFANASAPALLNIVE